MKRRKFINASVAASACALLVPAAAFAGKPQVSDKKTVCKITVLKKTLEKDYINEFRGAQGGICEVFHEGQEFIVDSIWQKPKGFCDWAWSDIKTYIHRVDGGLMDVMVACCTDGFRPVFFKLERIEVPG